MKVKEIFEGVFLIGGQLTTKNLISGRSYSEKIINDGGREYRVWNPEKSKAAAAITRGIKNFPIKKGSKILYLGIAQGQTASYFSDIIGNDGIIYGVEFSSRAVSDLVRACEQRGNIVPIKADARKPEDYSWVEKVDVIYEDVADSEQVAILLRNVEAFLKKGGYAMIGIKARSIDVTKDPAKIFQESLAAIKTRMEVLDYVTLGPYEVDHAFIVCRPM
ncbi:MAG: fibrillarin-like rRNA/tRNA 2'-O-methyltransferase [Candidatus Aenigmarchaeota archaeon]|nr:fibrillarin-like rRNA/tRNA 2'-O-methyltransferase [Candidatus Aenigmarchaeota archaeon]